MFIEKYIARITFFKDAVIFSDIFQSMSGQTCFQTGPIGEEERVQASASQEREYVQNAGQDKERGRNFEPDQTDLVFSRASIGEASETGI
jgi:hypothetical protein